MSNPRCTPCTRCTAAGCIDLGPQKSIGATLGETRHSLRWLLTGYGAFAAAFPGFVVGYYTTTDGPLASAGSVYLNVGMWMVVSYVAVAFIVAGLRMSTTRVFILLAATAAGLYYWFAGDAITTAFAVEGVATWAIRVAGIGLVVYWLGRAWLGSVETARTAVSQPGEQRSHGPPAGGIRAAR